MITASPCGPFYITCVLYGDCFYFIWCNNFPELLIEAYILLVFGPSQDPHDDIVTIRRHNHLVFVLFTPSPMLSIILFFLHPLFPLSHVYVYTCVCVCVYIYIHTLSHTHTYPQSEQVSIPVVWWTGSGLSAVDALLVGCPTALWENVNLTD